MLLTTTSERQGRVIDHDSVRVDGEEEAGGLLLMALAHEDLIATDIEAYLEAHEHKSLLRFITCGSVDDGKSTLDRAPPLRVPAGVRRPPRRPGGRLEAGRDPRRRPRLRPAGRRTGGRARAGHHHRRGLPVLLHREAQVHRRRHSRARAVHPQHGDRGVDGRPGRHPHRRPQGGPDPDPASQLSGLPPRDPARWCWRSTSWTWSTTPRRSSTRSSRTTAPSRRRSA